MNLLKQLLALAGLAFVHSVAAQTYSIPLVWRGDSLGDVWNPHASLLLPVTPEGSTRTLYMQFDLGAPHSFFYKDQFTRAYPGQPVGDTLSGLRLRIGMMDKVFGSIPLRPVAGSADVVGTLGADILEGRVAVFDYPRSTLVLSDTTPASYPAPTHPCFIGGGRIFLPSVIGGKQTLLYFDTGSSAFELLTDSATWGQMADPGATPVTYPVNSWGKTLQAHTVRTSDSVTIAGLQLPLRRVTYIEGADTTQAAQMRRMGIGGMTGNVLFLHVALVLDMRRRLFALTP